MAPCLGSHLTMETAEKTWQAQAARHIGNHQSNAQMARTQARGCDGPHPDGQKSPAAMRVISSALVVRETGRAARIWHTTHPVHRASRRGALRTERRRGPSGAAMCAKGGGQLWHRRPLARRRARRRAAPRARTLRLRDCPCAHGSRGLHRRSGATHTTLRRKPWVSGSRRCPCPLARRWARAQLNTPHGLGIRWGRCPWDGQRRRPKTAADTAGCRWWCQGALKWAP